MEDPYMDEAHFRPAITPTARVWRLGLSLLILVSTLTGVIDGSSKAEPLPAAATAASLFQPLTEGMHSPPSAEKNVVLLCHFDSDVRPDFSIGTRDLISQNAGLVANGKWGHALDLGKAAYLAVPVNDIIKSSAGTIMFWLRPQWSPDGTSSHTFLSMRWADGKKGYLALTNGWWEPQGAKRLYFILNNQINAVCSTISPLRPNTWHHIAVTWQMDKNPLVRIHVDEDLIAWQSLSRQPLFLPDSHLYIGSDMGTTEAKGRSADSLIDELVIYDRALSTKEISTRYRQQEYDLEQVMSRKEAWLRDLTVHPRRKSNGQVGFRNRIILDEGIEWALSKKAVDDVLTRIKMAGFNVYAPCVWHGAGSRWLSKLVAPEWEVRSLRFQGGFDPLAYLVQRAHKMGIKVYPWFTVVLRQTWGNIPARFLAQYYDSGTPADAFNVHNPDFAKFIADVALEMARTYDIDGIFLDYVRSMGICTSDACKADYRDLTGRDLGNDLRLYNQQPEIFNSIAQWNETAMHAIVDNISEGIRKSKAGLVICAHGSDVPSTRLQGRNVIKWANEGVIDLISHGDYGARLKIEAIDREIDQLKDPGTLFVTLGNLEMDYSYYPSRSPELLIRLIQFTSRRWPGNTIAIYFYKSLTDEQIDALRNEFILAPPQNS